MKKSHLIAGILGLAACGQGADTGGTGDTSGLTGDPTAGATVFQDCAACHGADGSGASGPALDALVPTLSDAEISDTILYGYGSMGPLDLTDQQILDVLAYLRATFT